MSKVTIRDLIGKPHNFTAKNGMTIHVEPNGVTEGVNSAVVPDVVYREAFLGKLSVETAEAANDDVTTAKKSSTSKKTEAVATTGSENTTASTNSKK